MESRGLMLKLRQRKEAWVSESKEPTNIIPFPAVANCPDCRGRGFIVGWSGKIKSEHKCPRCNGQGKFRIA